MQVRERLDGPQYAAADAGNNDDGPSPDPMSSRLPLRQILVSYFVSLLTGGLNLSNSWTNSTWRAVLVLAKSFCRCVFTVARLTPSSSAAS